MAGSDISITDQSPLSTKITKKSGSASNKNILLHHSLNKTSGDVSTSVMGQTLTSTSNGNMRQQQQQSPPSSKSLPRKTPLRRQLQLNNSRRAGDGGTAVPPPRSYKPAQRHQPSTRRIAEIDGAELGPSTKKQKSVHAPPTFTAITEITRRPSMDRNRFGNKKRIVVPDSQRSTNNLSLVDDIISSSSASWWNTTGQMRQTAAAAKFKAQQQRPATGHFGSSSYYNINLRARVYTPLTLFRSHIGGKHLGSVCEPVMETILVNRNSIQIGKWRNMECPPPYFTRAEMDAEISRGEDSEYNFMRKAALYGLAKPIQSIIRNYENIRDECNTAMRGTYNLRKPKSVPENWWPVGCNGGLKRKGNFVNTEPLVECCNKYNGNKATDITWMARSVFKLPEDAIKRIINKETSLLYEISSVCERWQEERNSIPPPKHVPSTYLPYLTVIGPHERFLQVKLGVYYMLERGTVIKFMTQPTALCDFVLESSFGFGIQREHKDRLKGTVGVLNMCPSGFCLEMEFSGVALQDVINGDINCELNRPGAAQPSSLVEPIRTPISVANNKKSQQPEMIQHHMAPSVMKGILYSVRMLQVTGRLPQSLQDKCKLPISDSFSAVGVVNTMRHKLLDELPFVIIEIANIVTRMSQQGLVNPDIKSDNIVIDGVTGQPKMIDFGLVIPSGRRDRTRSVEPTEKGIFSEYPQTAPEYLRGGICTEPSMVYGLSYLVYRVLHNISIRTGDMSAASMMLNIPLCDLMAKAYNPDPEKRPRASEFAPVIGAIFPFNSRISRLFKHPMHTL